jgi:hypothetical protein
VRARQPREAFMLALLDGGAQPFSRDSDPL